MLSLLHCLLFAFSPLSSHVPKVDDKLQGRIARKRHSAQNGEPSFSPQKGREELKRATHRAIRSLPLLCTGKKGLGSSEDAQLAGAGGSLGTGRNLKLTQEVGDGALYGVGAQDQRLCDLLVGHPGEEKVARALGQRAEPKKDRGGRWRETKKAGLAAARLCGRRPARVR